MGGGFRAIANRASARKKMVYGLPGESREELRTIAIGASARKKMVVGCRPRIGRDQEPSQTEYLPEKRWFMS